MISKVYFRVFKEINEGLLASDDDIDIDNEDNEYLEESRFALFFNELQRKEEEQTQLEYLSTSGSGSGSPSSQKKVQPLKTLNIDILKVLAREDRRTTLMIKNIPNKFTKEMLLALLDQKFNGLYDMFIMPTNAQDNKNFGYAFINFTHSLHIVYFYHVFNKSNWEYTNSKKICQITYSKIQGKSKLKKHYPFKNTYISESATSGKRVPSFCFMIPNVYKDQFILWHQNAKVFPSEQFCYCYI